MIFDIFRGCENGMIMLFKKRERENGKERIEDYLLVLTTVEGSRTTMQRFCKEIYQKRERGKDRRTAYLLVLSAVKGSKTTRLRCLEGIRRKKERIEKREEKLT